MRSLVRDALARLATLYAALTVRMHAATFGTTWPESGSPLRVRLATFDYVGVAANLVIFAVMLACFAVPLLLSGCSLEDAANPPSLLLVPLGFALVGLVGLAVSSERRRRRTVREQKRASWEASRTPSDVFYTYPVGVPSVAMPRPDSDFMAGIRAEANEDARKREREIFTAPGPDMASALVAAAYSFPNEPATPTYSGGGGSFDSCDYADSSSGGGCE